LDVSHILLLRLYNNLNLFLRLDDNHILLLRFDDNFFAAIFVLNPHLAL